MVKDICKQLVSDYPMIDSFWMLDTHPGKPGDLDIWCIFDNDTYVDLELFYEIQEQLRSLIVHTHVDIYPRLKIELTSGALIDHIEGNDLSLVTLYLWNKIVPLTKSDIVVCNDLNSIIKNVTDEGIKYWIELYSLNGVNSYATTKSQLRKEFGCLLLNLNDRGGVLKEIVYEAVDIDIAIINYFSQNNLFHKFKTLDLNSLIEYRY